LEQSLPKLSALVSCIESIDQTLKSSCVISEPPACIATATAMEAKTILMIGKEEIFRALHAEHELSDTFIAYLLRRTMQIEENLIDQLFSSTKNNWRVTVVTVTTKLLFPRSHSRLRLK